MQQQVQAVNADMLAELILADSARLLCAAETGLGWEHWLQVELAVRMCEQGGTAVRHKAYPSPRQRWNLALWAALCGQPLALEIAAESGVNDGGQLLNSVHQELAKIVYFSEVPAAGRWVVALAYSNTGRAALTHFCKDEDNNGYYVEQGNLGLLLAQP
ncbi:hypothetical protein [Gallaecimonas mangrovi]|uniref:hypothetical protein n=1 Tax=Gallaecimonas mangrovi TaxID=2291597 RepID=UPI000E1FBF84|nr:hypothetical protein [Gallaecimonas mangrovi]